MNPLSTSKAFLILSSPAVLPEVSTKQMSHALSGRASSDASPCSESFGPSLLGGQFFGSFDCPDLSINQALSFLSM